jgi:pyruvate kinase
MIDQLLDLRAKMADVEKRFKEDLERIPAESRASARNLLHYVVLRRHDIRPLQEQLVSYGLSSLGRCESHVLANVNAVLEILARLSGRDIGPTPSTGEPVDFPRGRALMEQCTEELFGKKPDNRGAHIMVTMPSEAADDYELIRDLLVAGMTCMRINCAHDDESVWARMIDNLRKAEQELGRSCRVMMDLAGPKIRTGPLESGPRVVHWRPHRDSYGRVASPARIWVTTDEDVTEPPSPADCWLPIEADWHAAAEVGDRILFKDTRDRNRSLTIVGKSAGGFWCEATTSAYLRPGLSLRLTGAKGKPSKKEEGRVGLIPASEQSLTLYPGDRLIVTDADKPGSPARYDDRGKLIERAGIGCTLPGVFNYVRSGDRILFDDGKIGGVVELAHENYLVVEITQAREKGETLRSDKGINFPDSPLRLPALTEKDLRDLEFIAKHADAVSYSFVRRVDDVYRLQSELERLGRPDLWIILKIENQKAVQRIVRLLLAVMSSPVAGVMIARGDLAVECGWQRLAEVQEEILWMCEAAHMPVIWATQVLESLAKKGLPSRSEVTDAAMGVRAECVMLNKGPNIVATVRALDDILRRMQDHQVKKRPMLRKLSLADDLLPVEE